MPTAQQGPWPNRFVWHDLITKDAGRAAEFYKSLLDWKINTVQMPEGPYHMIECGPGPIGGICEQPNSPASYWMPHLCVNDVDATATLIKSLGGSIVMPPTDIPQTGRFAIGRRPPGWPLLDLQGIAESPGFDPDLGIPGRACWNELYTSDDAAALRFYSKVFGWSDEPKDLGPMGTYHVQMLGDKQVGGLMKNPMPGAPTGWVVYFFVLDLTAATQKAKQLGATPIMEGMPIPGIGSFSMLTDPTGAMFTLFQPMMNNC
jgi:predicted enzyme related to lactoylglutathione lyase